MVGLEYTRFFLILLSLAGFIFLRQSDFLGLFLSLSDDFRRYGLVVSQHLCGF